MGEVVNLRTARKVKARETAAAKADANRAAFGRSKSDRAATTAEIERNTRNLDGAKLDD